MARHPSPRKLEAVEDLLDVLDALADIGRVDRMAAAPAPPPPSSGRGRRRLERPAAGRGRAEPPDTERARRGTKPGVDDVLGSLAHVASLQGREAVNGKSLQVLQEVIRDWLAAEARGGGSEVHEFYAQASDHVRRLAGRAGGKRPEPSPHGEPPTETHGEPPTEKRGQPDDEATDT